MDKSTIAWYNRENLVMAHSETRYRNLIKILTVNPSLPLYKACMQAGFTEQTSKKQAKSVLNHALAWQATEAKKETMPAYDKKEGAAGTPTERRMRIHERLGLSRTDLYENIKWLAEQEKDLSVRLRVIRTLARDLDVPIELDDDRPTVNVPVLNVTVRENTPQAPLQVDATPVQGLIKPPRSA